MKLLKHVFITLKTESPILFWITMLHFFGALACIPAIVIDDRTLLGVNVWIKPLKFLISGGIYVATVGYLITFYPYSKKKKDILRNINSWALLLEIAIIVYQGARGVQSHYNQASLFDGLLFAAMGILISINVLLMVLLLIAVCY